ncbi:MAG: hypothetical protein ACTSVW_00895 [Candidatus Njordarchaeales archaeon]
MPKVPDLFVHKVKKKETMIEIMESGRISKIDDDFRNMLRRLWHHLPERELEGFRLFAVDGTRECGNMPFRY